MRQIIRVLVLGATLAVASTLPAQQPQIINAQLTTQSASRGLGAEIDSLKHSDAPVWLGYSIPVAEHFHGGWNSERIAYLEDDHHTSISTDGTKDSPQDHAVLLFRIAAGSVNKLRVESPDRQIDAGGTRFVWLTDVTQPDSIATLKALAIAEQSQHLRDSAILFISLHQSSEATKALVDLAAPSNDRALREKAAFWLANQRGKDGLAAIQRFAREDPDARFREKLAFDLTLSKEPAAIDELIRMAHSDGSPQVRKQAQFWMAMKGGKRVTADLRDAATSDPDGGVRKSAVFALSRLPGDEAATQLIQVAGTSHDPEVRRQAIFWLGQSNDPRALDYLTKLLSTN